MKILSKTAYIGLGSNLGNRLENLNTVVKLLCDSAGITVDLLSAVYETAPVGGPKQGAYLNACAGISTTLGPISLLDKLLALEKRLKRVRKEHWGPRTIDLDLLYYEGIRMNTPRLQIPHPRVHERGFVLIPLAEIAPGLILFPGGPTIAEMAAPFVSTPDISFHSYFKTNLPGSLR